MTKQDLETLKNAPREVVEVAEALYRNEAEMLKQEKEFWGEVVGKPGDRVYISEGSEGWTLGDNYERAGFLILEAGQWFYQRPWCDKSPLESHGEAVACAQLFFVDCIL